MRIRVLVIVLAVRILHAPTGWALDDNATAHEPALQVDVAAVDALLSRYARERVFSGEVLVALGDRVLLHDRYGYNDWSRKTPLPEGGIYKIGSITKQFTAAAILRLEVQGRLSSSDPVRKYIPELPATLSGSEDSALTIHHLVTHTSGLMNPLYANVWGAEQGFDTVLDALEATQLRHPHGAEFHYNNIGYAILGEIIRRVTGQTYEAFLTREFFEPLGMSSTGVKLSPAQRDRLVTGNVSNVFTLLPSTDAFGRFITGNYEWDLFANGNVSSNVVDLHRWVRALQQGTLFGPEMMDKMRTPERRDYSYGWVLKQTETLDEPLYWHNGAIIPFGYSAHLAWSQRSRLCVVILSNLDDTVIAQNVFGNVMKSLRGAPVEAARAGFEAKGSYLTIQILALVFGTSLLAWLVGIYAIYALGFRRHRSRLQLYNDVANTLSMAILFVAINDRVPGAIVLVFVIGLAAWAGWRSRRQPLLHTTPWKQWLTATATAVGVAMVLVVAGFIHHYF